LGNALQYALVYLGINLGYGSLCRIYNSHAPCNEAQNYQINKNKR